MTRKLIFTLLVACLAFAGTYAQSLQNHIPKDATFVMTMNPSVLNSKVKFEKLKEFDFIKKGIAEMTKQAGPMGEEIKKFINDPKEFGMDMMSSSYAFGKVDGENIHMGFVLKVSDKAKFDNLINTYVAPMAPVQKGDNLSYVSMDGVNLSWNGDQILISTVELDYEEGEEYEAHKTRKEKEAMSWMNTVMKGNKVNSIATHPKFKMAGVNQDDLNVWMDYEAFAKFSQDMQGGGMDPMTQMMMGAMSGMYEDTYFSMGLNFDKGATKINSRYFMNDEMTEIYKKVLDAPFNKKFFQYVPKNNLGYFTFNFNLKNVVDIIKNSDNEMLAQFPLYEGMAVEAVKGLGLEMTADDIYNLWKGDVMIVVTGMKEFEKEVTTYEFDDDFNKKEVKEMKKENLPEFVMMMSHGSKENLLKVIDLGKQSSMIEEKKGFFQVAVPDMPMDVFMKVEDDMILVSNNMDVVTKKARKLLNKSDLMGPAEIAKITNSAQRIYWNIPETMKIIETMEEMDKDSPEEMLFNMGKDSFNSLEIDTNKKMGASMSSVMSLNFNNGNMNSLEQIFGMINKAFKTMSGDGSSM